MRRRIQYCNNTISNLMQEMAAFHDTEHFIDWTNLIDRMKTYRDELEKELVANNKNHAVVEPVTPALFDTLSPTLPPDPRPDPDEQYESEDDPYFHDDEEFSY
jgi:hypothetical protein